MNRRQSELLRQQYQQGDHHPSKPDRSERSPRKSINNDNKEKGVNSIGDYQGSNAQRYQTKCWNCKKTGHQAKDCQFQKRDSTG